MISFEQLVLEDNVPIYLQIGSFIKAGIAAGTIHDGDELPSRRSLSALLGINPNTVQKALATLEEEGLVSSRSGAKSCVCADAETVGRVRRELLDRHVKSLVSSMKQLGVSCGEAQLILAELWEEESV